MSSRANGHDSRDRDRDRDRVQSHRERESGRRSRSRSRDRVRKRSRSKDKDRDGRDRRTDSRRNRSSSPDHRRNRDESKSEERLDEFGRVIKCQKDIRRERERDTIMRNESLQDSQAAAAAEISPEAEVQVPAVDEEMTPEEEMMKLMGFAGFDSTKGKMVDSNFEGAGVGLAAKNKGRKYRQYMNRRGGFNRPLAKMP